MKKYACHRIYDRESHYYPQSVVVINDDGRIDAVYQFEQEMASTEWIGGIIVLSDKAVMTPHRDFKSILRYLTSSTGQALYAWHFSTFHFEAEELAPTCIIRRL